MNFEEQLRSIRTKYKNDYTKYVAGEEMKKQIEHDKELINRQKEVMSNLSTKYGHLFNPSREQKAAKIINKFVINNWFEPPCINSIEEMTIPGIYRFRVYITNHHMNDYTEENISPEMLDSHRKLYKLGLPEKIILFRYCFDIRKIYPVRNYIMELYDDFYFLQPDDHERLVRAWSKVNGETPTSIIFLTDLDFSKSLCSDKKNNTNAKKEKINFLENITDEYLDDLNRKYING